VGTYNSSGNTANDDGGGIFSLGTVNMNSGSSISGNTANEGSGIWNCGTLKIAGGIISKNSAKQSGGGIKNVDRGTGTESVTYKGVVNIYDNSTITQNTADSDKTWGGSGGGIYWQGTTGSLNFFDEGDGDLKSPNDIIFDNHLGNGDINDIVPSIP
jgi:hypothetical protein